MCKRCREILCSVSEEKLPKLSEEKLSKAVAANDDDDDDDDDDIVITKMKELTMVRGIVINYSPLLKWLFLRGDVMKNMENNFCWNTKSRRAGQQKYLARGPFVLKEIEDTPLRPDLNIINSDQTHSRKDGFFPRMSDRQTQFPPGLIQFKKFRVF